MMSDSTPKKKPMVIITIGMAGAGKSTFVQRINSYLHSIGSPPYILNLDPAVSHVPFEPNIDIRDTVNYKEVMKQCVLLLRRLSERSVLALCAKGTTLDPTAAL
jgi:GTPase SAR1 family protein